MNSRLAMPSGLRSNFTILATALSLFMAQMAFADNSLKDMKLTSQPDGKTIVTLQFSEPVGEVNAFSTDNPPRIAIDLPNTELSLSQKKLVSPNGAAKSVNAVNAGGRTRVVVDLAKNSQYKTQTIGNSLVLTIDPKAVAQSSVAVSAINFQRTEKGAGRLVIQFNGAGSAPQLKESGSELVLDLGKTALPAEFRKTMDFTGLSTPVLNIAALENAGNSRLVLNTKNRADVMAYQTGNEFVLEVNPKLLAKSSAANGAIATES